MTEPLAPDIGREQRLDAHAHRVWNHACECPESPCHDCLFRNRGRNEIEKKSTNQKEIDIRIKTLDKTDKGLR
jgi:hypothetical protein